MSDELRRSERSLVRVDYSVLGSSGGRLVIAPTSQQAAISQQSATTQQSATATNPPHNAPGTESPDLSVNETTFLDRIQLPPDTDDQSSTYSDESSNESTLTPASSDSNALDVTLIADSPELNLDLQISPQTNSFTNSSTAQIDCSQATSSANTCLDSSALESISSQPTGHQTTDLFDNLDNQLLNVLDEINNTVAMSNGAHELSNQINLLVEDLNDFIDEHSMHDAYITAEDIDERTKRVEGMRSKYRELHRYLKDTVGETIYEEKHLTTIKQT